MQKKKALITLSTAIALGVLGAASMAQASDHPNYTNGTKAYGYANPGKANGYDSGRFVNGNFIPRGTSPAQVPAFHEEDDYGPEAGKD